MKKTTILLISLMVTSAGFLSGCTDSVLQSGNAEIINYDIKEHNHRIVIEVELGGDSDLGIALSKENSEICYYEVEERKLKDGSEIVYLEMCNNEYETPKGGTYMLNVYHNDDIILTEEISKIGPLLNITYLHAEDEAYDYSDTRYFTDFTISYENIGDLPAYVSQIYLDSGKDTSYKSVSETAQYIGVGESTTLSGSIFLETYYYVNGHILANLLDSNGDVIGLPYFWNEE
ncbi:MAG: hypothetical protein ACOC5T_09450 [Elusimicrobiota bacterium]